MKRDERLVKLILQSRAKSPLPDFIHGVEGMERVEQFICVMRKTDLLASQHEMIERWGRALNIDIKAARQEIQEQGFSLGLSR